MASRAFAARAQAGRSGGLRLLGALQLGGGRAVAAVGAGRHVLLLGLGDKQVSLLLALEDDGTFSAPAPPPFAGVLAQLRRGAGRDA
jgi:flagellar biogenesis protein FliO